MTMQSIHRTIDSIAKQAGCSAGSWLAINLSSYDRTPLEYMTRVREGDGYC